MKDTPLPDTHTNTVPFFLIAIQYVCPIIIIDFLFYNKDSDETLYLEITCKEHGQFPYICDCSYCINSNCVKIEGTNKHVTLFELPFKCVYDVQIDLFDILTLRGIFFLSFFF